MRGRSDAHAYSVGGFADHEQLVQILDEDSAEKVALLITISYQSTRASAVGNHRCQTACSKSVFEVCFGERVSL